MYYCSSESPTTTNQIISRRSSSNIYGPYSNKENITFARLTGKDWWHFGVKYLNNKYYITAGTCVEGTPGEGDYIYIGVSTDGLTFTRKNYPLVRKSAVWDVKFYMSTICNIGAGLKLYLVIRIILVHQNG